MREDFESRMRERKMRCEQRMERRGSHNHIWTGLFILLIGVAALVKASVTDLPEWVFSWQTFLIALGFFVGIRHGFKGAAWFILILIGGAFLLRDFYPDLAIRRYIWPAALIVVGGYLIIRPRRHHHWYSPEGEKKNVGPQPDSSIPETEETWSQDNFVNTNCVFGGTKRNILSKEFKGGDIVNLFGGTEINLSQADIQGTVVIEITNFFGGTKLIVPSNWEVKSEAVTVFGGMEDKRSVAASTESSGKILMLNGTVIFGGIEIKSF